MRLTMALIVAIVLSAAAFPQQQTAPDPFLRWLDKIAQAQLQAREDAVAKVRTVADAEQRKKLVRANILEALGGS